MYKVKSYMRFQILLKKKRLTQRKINSESKLSISTTLRIYSQVTLWEMPFYYQTMKLFTTDF